MELLIVSGLSGAGKSVAMNALEDIGYFCIDNIPAGILPRFVEYSEAGENMLQKVAIAMDIRGARSSQEIMEALAQLDERKVGYRILFIDASDDVLQRRYKETRRRHPISISMGISTAEAIERERKILRPLQERANYQLDTSMLSTAQNRERIVSMFMQGGSVGDAMALTVMSFGFKYGLPKDADLVFDVRCLPNPFYVPELKEKTGMDKEVADYVMSFEESREFLHRLESLLEYALPLYVKEGKSQLMIGVGCTGGKHRSITFARLIGEFCQKLGYHPSIQHRDALR
ncbi:MAG: RNase adapter RapZ [Faecalibacterium sp.]|jgi:UPF0042 nucleotide-binding protein|nr:RNase adapter RapZ [Faecalibacterium sp.]